MGVETMKLILNHANVQIGKLLRKIFNDIKVVPVTRLAAMRIDFKDAR